MWKLLSDIASFKSPWIALIGERWEDDQGAILDYWRIDSSDSVIVVPEYKGNYILPARAFRPGVGRETLDFPGGRRDNGMGVEETARSILHRELGVSQSSIVSLSHIFDQPALVNSSTSNQRLHGLHARLDELGDDLRPHFKYEINEVGTRELLAELECLQCRAILLELLRSDAMP